MYGLELEGSRSPSHSAERVLSVQGATFVDITRYFCSYSCSKITITAKTLSYSVLASLCRVTTKYDLSIYMIYLYLR